MPQSGSFILGIKWKSQGLKPYDFHIAGNGLYTMLVTRVKESKTSNMYLFCISCK